MRQDTILKLLLPIRPKIVKQILSLVPIINVAYEKWPDFRFSHRKNSGRLWSGGDAWIHGSLNILKPFPMYCKPEITVAIAVTATKKS